MFVDAIDAVAGHPRRPRRAKPRPPATNRYQRREPSVLAGRRDVVRRLRLLGFEPCDVGFRLGDDLPERFDHPWIVSQRDDAAKLLRPGANVRDQLVMHAEAD